MKTKFTVVIPTRERCDTLKYAIETCVGQDYDNLEILVSDNASEDDTRKIVQSFKDPRIRYVNPGHRVSMVENFEFAFSHVNEGYVVAIGDDDGLVTDALCKVDTLIKKTDAKAVVSDFAQYMWPNIDTNAANQLVFSPRKGFEIRNSQKYLSQVLYKRHAFNHLPCIYYGFIDCRLINELRTKQSGKLFLTSVVDVYTAIALSAYLKEYCYSFEPLTINGTSGRSNGASFMQISKDEGEKKRWFTENTTTRKPPFFASGGIKMLIAEACNALEKNDSNAFQSIQVDYDELLQQAIEDLVLYPKYGFEESSILSLARNFGAKVDTPNTIRKLKARFDLYSDRIPKFLRAVIIDASHHGALDVNAAAQLMSRLQKDSAKGLSIEKFSMLTKRFFAVR